MKRLIVAVMCLLPVALMGCGERSEPAQEEAAGDGGEARASTDETAAQEINWGADVTMAMRGRIRITLAMVEELSMVFPLEDYPALEEAQGVAAALRAETTMANTEAVEAAVNAFGETLGPEDKKIAGSARMEALLGQYRYVMMDYIVQSTEHLLAELVQAFPPGQYPEIQTFQQVAETAIANMSPEADRTLKEAMATFKASLSAADRQRFEEIEAAVELAEATLAAEQGN